MTIHVADLHLLRARKTRWWRRVVRLGDPRLGDRGSGTSGYRTYSRDSEVRGEGTPTIVGSADPAFCGDPQRWNPQELLVASLSQCHMLWYSHLAAVAGVVVTAYTDTRPPPWSRTPTDGGGQFSQVVLRPSEGGTEMIASGAVNVAVAIGVAVGGRVGDSSRH